VLRDDVEFPGIDGGAVPKALVDVGVRELETVRACRGALSCGTFEIREIRHDERSARPRTKLHGANAALRRMERLITFLPGVLLLPGTIEGGSAYRLEPDRALRVVVDACLDLVAKAQRGRASLDSNVSSLGLNDRTTALLRPPTARRALARQTGLTSFVRWAFGAADVGTASGLAKRLYALPSSKKLRWLAGEDAGAFEAFPKRRFAREVANRELLLAATFSDLALIMDEACFVDCDTAFATLRRAARFDDSTRLAFLARPISGRDFDALEWRNRFIAPRERDANRHDPPSSSLAPHLMSPTEARARWQDRTDRPATQDP